MADEFGGVFGIVDDVDLLAVQLVHHIADPLAHRTNAGALGVDALHIAAYGDLGAVAGLAGDRDDVDGAVTDLGHFECEEFADQVWVGAREQHLRAAEASAYAHHQALDAGAV